MPAKAAVVLAIPLVFATAVAFADTSNRTGYRSPFVAEAMSKSPADRIAAVRKPSTATSRLPRHSSPSSRARSSVAAAWT